MTPRFGISTHLFHGQPLGREHLVEVAAHGFDAVEVYATRTHFDYHDPAAVVSLAEWLDDTRLALHSVHAPTTASYRHGQWGDTLSIADVDEARRRRAVAEAVTALGVASMLPFGLLVVHLGVPSEAAGSNSRAAVARSLEEIGDAAAGVGVALALELIPNALSSAERLVRWLEDDLELDHAGICLDVGHANLAGDVMEAVETCSGHILTTHVHDNSGRRDDHLVPGQGRIDWNGVLMAFQKVGYDGAWMFELAPAADPPAVLREAARARESFERLLRMAP
ncbi:MAG TPA: sugar phosphate isomerase/epimerase family protein [Vicinamibacterales bacterium]|nr:sugar phosphate isomerase/epimerase family protein [Vicinamibacterales bacterium]